MEAHHEAAQQYREERVPHIETKDLKRSSVPMAIYLQEADSLALWCLTDREKLFAAGLEREVIDALPERIDLARRAETFRNGFMKRRKTDTAYVRKLSAQAREIKGELVRDLRFAMKRSGDVEDALLRYIEKRRTEASLVQSLNDLSIQCKKKSKELFAIGVGREKWDGTAGLSKELGSALADRHVRKGAEAHFRELRDRAFTHLNESVGAIRLCGRYVFHTNPDRKMGYASAYRRKKKPAD